LIFSPVLVSVIELILPLRVVKLAGIEGGLFKKVTGPFLPGVVSFEADASVRHLVVRIEKERRS